MKIHLGLNDTLVIVKKIGIDMCPPPSHLYLIEVLQPIKTYCRLFRKHHHEASHMDNAHAYGNYSILQNTITLALFYLLSASNDLYKLFQDTASPLYRCSISSEELNFYMMMPYSQNGQGLLLQSHSVRGGKKH